MPPAAVVEASPNGPFYRKIAIEDVQGTPEFLFFDGGGLFTTRPTHKQVLTAYTDDLSRANLLADSRAYSDYMLYVKFEDLHGPDVWIGSDKRASARIIFNLVRWRTGEVVKRQQIELAYTAQSPGFTARQVAAGSVGLAAGVASGFNITRSVISVSRSYKDALHLSTAQAASIGAYDGAAIGLDVGELVLLTLNAGSITPNDHTPLTTTSEIGPLDGTDRRIAAVRGLLDLALDEFLHELSKDGSVVYKQAVSCSELNPYGYAQSYLAETSHAYAIDCPKSSYFASRLYQAFPSNF